MNSVVTLIIGPKRKTAFFIFCLSLNQLFFGQHRLIIASIGERPNHGSGGAFIGPSDLCTKIFLARDQFRPFEGKIVAAIESILARIYKESARPFLTEATVSDRE